MPSGGSRPPHQKQTLFPHYGKESAFGRKRTFGLSAELLSPIIKLCCPRDFGGEPMIRRRPAEAIREQNWFGLVPSCDGA